jgi:hypothetical protein
MYRIEFPELIVLNWGFKEICTIIKDALLRIRDVYSGSLNQDPGSDCFHPGSRVHKIPDPGYVSASKNLSIFIFKPTN